MNDIYIYWIKLVLHIRREDLRKLSNHINFHYLSPHPPNHGHDHHDHEQEQLVTGIH